MNHNSEYHVIVEHNPHDLSEAVTAMLKRGFVTIGGVSVAKGQNNGYPIYAQAIVYYDNLTDYKSE